MSLAKKEQSILRRIDVLRFKTPFFEVSFARSPVFTGPRQAEAVAERFFKGYLSPNTEADAALIEEEKKHELDHALADRRLVLRQEIAMYTITTTCSITGRRKLGAGYVSSGERTFEENREMDLAPINPSKTDLFGRGKISHNILVLQHRLLDSLPYGLEIDLGILFIRRRDG